MFTLKQTLGIEGGDMMQAVLSIPNVMVSYEELAPEEEWKVVQSAIGEALADIKNSDSGKVRFWKEKW